MDFSIVGTVKKGFHDDIRHIIQIDKWFSHFIRHKADLALPYAAQKMTFTEVLIEPGGTNDCPVKRGICQNFLASPDGLLPSAGKQHRF